jgi:hypothetical protein
VRRVQAARVWYSDQRFWTLLHKPLKFALTRPARSAAATPFVTSTAAKIASARRPSGRGRGDSWAWPALLAVLVPWAARVQIERTELDLAALQNSLAKPLWRWCAASTASGGCPDILV